jgi:iron-sulfur cluster repair protein YtfE (RIC family)
MSHTCSCGTNRESSPSSTPITAEQIVAEVSKRAGALEVFQRLGINHCCGAHLSLREAAAAAGVPLDRVLSALDETASAAA